MLLILAGVTIVTLFGENGIITSAQKAKKQTESGTSTELAGMEELLNKMNQAIGGKVEEVPEVLRKYILGDEQKGRPVDEILELTGTDITDLNNFKFKSNETIPNANEKIKVVGIDENAPALLIMYESKKYMVTVEQIEGSYILPLKTVEITIAANLEPIYDGYTQKAQVNGYEIFACYAPGLLSKMNPYNLYTCVIENEGTTSTFTGYWNDFGGPIIEKNSENPAFLGANIESLISFYQNYIGLGLSTAFGTDGFEKEGIRVKIYDAGPRTDLAFEGDFIAWFDSSDNKWSLAKTPSESYEVPHTVNGNVIEKIILSSVSGSEIIINEPVSLETTDVYSIDKIILKTPDTDWFFTSGIDLYSIKNLDLSQCGDNITIPDEAIKNIKENIYVSPAVKAKYPDNDKIVAK